MGHEGTWPRWYTEAGNLVLLADEAEHQRAEAERQRAEQAEEHLATERQRAERLAEQLHNLGIEPAS